MNPRSQVSIPPQEEGTFGNWTYHEWAEAFSTNDLARAFSPWHIAVCKEQTGGRGRFNRKWIGQTGGLWASFNVPIDEKKNPEMVNWGHLPLVAGVALLEMLRANDMTQARLRWPNDLLVGNAKLAGILVERPAADMAVIGIGINVFNDVVAIAGEVKDPPARLADLTNRFTCIHEVMEELAAHLESVYHRFSRGGLAALKDQLERAWAGSRQVSVELDEETVTGRFRGIDDRGNPVLILSNQSIRIIPAHLVNRLVELPV